MGSEARNRSSPESCVYSASANVKTYYSSCGSGVDFDACLGFWLGFARGVFCTVACDAVVFVRVGRHRNRVGGLTADGNRRPARSAIALSFVAGSSDLVHEQLCDQCGAQESACVRHERHHDDAPSEATECGHVFRNRQACKRQDRRR